MTPSFYDLPREIRDQIYTNLLSVTYIVYSRHHDSYHQRSQDTEPPPADLSILLTSKQINKEAQDVMYKCGIFRYITDIEEDTVEEDNWDQNNPLSDTQISAMRNIEIMIHLSLNPRRIRLRPYGDEPRNWEDPAIIGSQYRVTNMTVGRIAKAHGFNAKTCKIEIRLEGDYGFPVAFLSMPIMQALKQFVAFETLELKIESEEELDYVSMLKTFGDEISRACGSTLGPFVNTYCGDYEDRVLKIEFRPRAYHLSWLEKELERWRANA